MIARSEFEEFVKKLTTKLRLETHSVNKDIIGAKIAPNLDDYVRFIYDEERKIIGVSFYIEAICTDAIQIFNGLVNLAAEQGLEKSVELLQTYYEDFDKNFFLGHDAKIAYEQDREDQALEEFSQMTEEEHSERLEELYSRKPRINWQ
jgi:hypothetical protein